MTEVASFERYWIERRWHPIAPPADADPGEDVTRTPTTAAEFEWLAMRGGLAEGETFPSEDEMRRQLDRARHAEADRRHGDAVPGHSPGR